MDLEEYRRKHTKEITGTAGDIYRIRKVPPLVLAQIMDLMGDVPIVAPDKLTDEHKEKLGKQMMGNLGELFRVLIPEVIIDPPVTEIPSENSLGINELNPDDVWLIFEEVMDFTSLTAEGFKDREKFRKESSGDAGGNDKPTAD